MRGIQGWRFAGDQLILLNNCPGRRQAGPPPDRALLAPGLQLAELFEHDIGVFRRRRHFVHPGVIQAPETASSTGPINRPIMPKAIRPPMTPVRMRIIGRSAPIRISTGRITLSMVPTTQLHTSSTVPGGVPAPVKPDNRRHQNQQRPELDQTGKDHHHGQQGGVGHAGDGKADPAQHRLSEAVTTTPSATARTARPASSTAASPRLAAGRVAK